MYRIRRELDVSIRVTNNVAVINTSLPEYIFVRNLYSWACVVGVRRLKNSFGLPFIGFHCTIFFLFFFLVCWVGFYFVVLRITSVRMKQLFQTHHRIKCSSFLCQVSFFLSYQLFFNVKVLTLWKCYFLLCAIFNSFAYYIIKRIIIFELSRSNCRPENKISKQIHER